MSRTRHRVSRALIAVLAVTLGLGIFFWVHKVRQSGAAPTDATAAAGRPKLSSEIKADELAKAGAPKPAAPPAVDPFKPSGPSALVTQTPTPGGATAVAKAAGTNTSPGSIVIIPSTRPAANRQGSPTTAPAVANISYSSTQPLVDAKAKFDAGQLLHARRILNTALRDNVLTDFNDVAAAKAMLSEINQTVVFSPKRFADDEFGGTYVVQAGNRLQKIAQNHEITWELLGRVNGLSDPRKMRAGQTLKLVKGPFHAVVDKSDFTLEVYLGGLPGDSASVYVTSFKVGLGADDSTPTGTWIVQGKLKNPAYFSPRGEGVIEADDPANPLGEYWLSLEGIDGHALSKQSYGIHGTIEPDSIGRQASMGCIRMHNEDVGRLFELLVEGKSTVLVQE